MDFNDRYADLWELVEKMNRAPKRQDQQCTPFLRNLGDLGAAIIAWCKLVRTRPAIRFIVFPPKGSGARIGHEFKNTFWREPLRKLSGKCPKDDSQESGV